MGVTLNLKEIGAVIFDLNGTIIDDGAYHDLAFQEFFKRHNSPLTFEDYRAHYYGRKNEEVMAELLNRELTDQEIAELSQEKEDIYHELYAPRIGEVAGFSNLIAALKREGIKVGLATSSAPTNLEFTFQHLPIEHYFDVIVDGWKVTQSKPHPEIFLKAAEWLGVAPEHCIVFEDTPTGITGAQRAGMRVIAMLTSHTANELPKVEGYITDFTEVTL
jgi:beta-phosphoglucomutase